MSSAIELPCLDEPCSSERSFETLGAGFRSAISKILAVPALVGTFAFSSQTMANPHSEEEGPKRIVEIEGGLIMGFPLRQKVREEAHSDEDHENHEHAQDHHNHQTSHLHSPFRLGVSYVRAFGEQDGHPLNRLKLAGGFGNDQLAIIGKFEAGFQSEKMRMGGGLTIDLHPGDSQRHDVAASFLARRDSFELLSEYRFRILNWFSLGATCLLEGHDGESHGGCGVTVGFQVESLLSSRRYYFLGADIATNRIFGRRGNKVWSHGHVRFGATIPGLLDLMH